MATQMLSAEQIARAEAVNIGDVGSERGFAFNRAGNHAGPCPRCGGKDRFSISVRRGAFLCRQCHPKGGGSVIRLVMFLDHCGFRDAVETLIGEKSAPIISRHLRNLPAKGSSAYERSQHDKARWLWSHRKPISDTIAERYLREARTITCPLPPTLGFLPPRKLEHHPAMIAAFALADECEPGSFAAPREVQAVHLTLLRADGSGKADVEPDKLIVGSPGKLPIVIAPMNDLLGLAVTEGIEDALSVHQATGLGVWAAGSAGRMPTLAGTVPNYADCVTIFADSDTTGTGNAALLAERLKVQGIHADILLLAEAVRCW
jgi:putative DNA primase/helicase